MTPVERYLDLLEKAVLGELQLEAEARLLFLRRCLAGRDLYDDATLLHIEEKRSEWVAEFARIVACGRVVEDDLANLGFAPSMIGRARLRNLAECLEQITRDNILGDVIECGVLRGGASLYMRGWLAVNGIEDRLVWLADSFKGLPPAQSPEEVEDLQASRSPMLAVGLPTVRALFERYALLDDRVRFLPGWFADTLPSAPIGSLAILRIDADYYASTTTALDALYDRVAPGGFVIIDDYNCIPSCRAAVDRFRAARSLNDGLRRIDWTGVYWRKSH